MVKFWPNRMLLTLLRLRPSVRLGVGRSNRWRDQMPTARLYARQLHLQPTLFIRPSESERDIEFQYQLSFCDGDDHLLGLEREEFAGLARIGCAYQAEQSRPVGSTRDLLCASTIVADRWIGGRLITAIGNSVVRRTKRRLGIAQVLAANVMASRFVFDDRRSLAVVSVTTRDATDSQRALKRAGAIVLSAVEAARAHPLLGEFHETRQTTFKARGFHGDGADLWVFTRAAIRNQLALAYEATSSNGLYWSQGESNMTVRVEGELTDYGARETMRKMITGEIDLPIDILDL